MLKLRILGIWLGLLLLGCGAGSGDDAGGSGGGDSSTDWLIPVGDVQDGGPGKDGIPAIDNPQFLSANADEVSLLDSQLIVGVLTAGQAKAYPHDILDWHEIVNDRQSDTSITLSYCPLTGSAITWEQATEQGDLTFGVSGLLYNSNLILYDRSTDSNWSQMQQRAVHGSRSGESLVARQRLTIETTWGQWRQWFTATLVLSRDTGFTRNYGVYPYGDYLVSSRLLFDTDNSDDNRLHPKARGLGVITSGAVKVYEISGFEDDFQVINDQVGGLNVVILGSRSSRFGLAFRRDHQGQTLMFEAVHDGERRHFKDQLGQVWDITGQGVSESVQGETLTAITHYTAFWFAWTAFFGDVELHAFK